MSTLAEPMEVIIEFPFGQWRQPSQAHHMDVLNRAQKISCPPRQAIY
jgi:hypothetical protein